MAYGIRYCRRYGEPSRVCRIWGTSRAASRDAQSRLPLREVGRLMPWHSHVRPSIVTAALNRMINDAMTGKAVFYPFYTEGEKQERTGLFYYRGKPGAPFALIFPGGGFSYVGSLHEGFPLADVLSRKGYNAFVLQYRTGSQAVAYEDMAAALSWIFHHAEELEISTQGYSLWGGSAGARMAVDLGSYGPAAFGGEQVPRPAAVVMGYTGHTRYTESDPPTFAVVSLDDPIASPRVMERRITALNAAGVDTEFHLYRNADMVSASVREPMRKVGRLCRSFLGTAFTKKK